MNPGASPSTFPYADPCTPERPVATRQPATTDVGTSRDVVGSSVAKQACGKQVNRRSVTITNQGDGLLPIGGSAIYVGPFNLKDNLASSGVLIPPGAARTFNSQAELWVLSSATGMPAAGNIFDVQNEYDG